MPSILRGFSAPVKLTTDLTNTDLRFLQLHDTDGFNRWEAGQTLALRTIESLMKDENAPIDGFISDFGTLLEQGLVPQTDKALLARSLSLPIVSVIGQTQEFIDPTRIDTARQKLLVTLKRTHKDLLTQLYVENENTDAFSITPEAMGQRSLRNILLNILTSTHGTGCATRAKTHYESANNMTDRVSALAVLSEMNTPERDEIFSDFYTRFKEYELVINKWMALQAMANRACIFDDLKTLRAHPEFNIKNPNRVRALYSAFTMNNVVKFHDKSGQGYDFLKEAIIELNTINPQIASRQITPLREWRRYTPDRQQKMQATLQEIIDTPNLSNDVFEVVSKSLKG